MKITKLVTFIVPPRWCFLKIETDEGIVGWGEPVVEGRAHTVAAAVDELADYLVGKDPLLIEDHWQVMYRSGFYRGGPIGMSAIAGVDQVCPNSLNSGAAAQVLVPLQILPVPVSLVIFHLNTGAVLLVISSA